jgi:hypothetical protein
MKIETTKKFIEFTDEESRDWLRVLLTECTISLTFTKKNGENRVIQATLNSKLIPNSENSVGNTKKRKISEEAQPVYDVEAKGWRSFRWDSISKLEFSIGDENVG